MEDKRKIFGTLLGILGFIAVIAGLTYAMYTTSQTNSNTIAGAHECVNINYKKGTDINVTELEQVDSYTQTKASTVITFNQDNNNGDCGNSIGTIYINTQEATDGLINGITETITSGTQSTSLTHGILRYTIEERIGTSTTVSQVFEGYVNKIGDTAVEVGRLNSTSTKYTVYLWLEKDKTNTITESTISEARYSGYIHAGARQSSTFEN